MLGAAWIELHVRLVNPEFLLHLRGRCYLATKHHSQLSTFWQLCSTKLHGKEEELASCSAIITTL